MPIKWAYWPLVEHLIKPLQSFFVKRIKVRVSAKESLHLSKKGVKEIGRCWPTLNDLTAPLSKLNSSKLCDVFRRILN
jgi:hypothetical protein